MKSVPILSGLVYLIRITPQRGSGVLGTLELGGEVVFESQFPSYKDAYWALMEMDGNEFVEISRS
jgi:hypothetical protein